jgi:glutamate-5-semialdehyde dehydrogenase
MTLQNGDRIVINGKPVVLDQSIINQFVDGDALFGLSSGQVLLIKQADLLLVDTAVSAASAAFDLMAACTEQQISSFYKSFAQRLNDESVRKQLLDANEMDVLSAKERGRSTTRLVLNNATLDDMVLALLLWQNMAQTSGRVLERVEHDGWSVQSEQAPLGVVGFVFEGRPNVFADATGVLRSGNTCVFRIGSDALNTARSMMQFALRPALADSGLPADAVVLLDASSHSSAWALFANKRLSLAVARGSGSAVEQLGEIARQSGTAVSLHGTGGAWMLIGTDPDYVRLSAVIERSLDRKVCNTTNVIGVPRENAADLVPIIAQAIAKAGSNRNSVAVVHACPETLQLLVGSDAKLDILPLQDGELSTEWEWDSVPECSIFVYEDVMQGIQSFNEYAPNFIVSLISNDLKELEMVWRYAKAPFVGNGMTRWVDGQFALDRPELGLSNWQNGRMLGRGAILSGDSVYSVRYRADQRDINLSR